jgi:hypothetical protein
MDYFPSQFFYEAIFIINFQNMSNLAQIGDGSVFFLRKFWRLTVGHSHDIDDNYRQFFGGIGIDSGKRKPGLKYSRREFLEKSMTALFLYHILR